jgi:hypothetical protein
MAAAERRPLPKDVWPLIGALQRATAATDVTAWCFALGQIHGVLMRHGYRYEAEPRAPQDRWLLMLAGEVAVAAEIFGPALPLEPEWLDLWRHLRPPD